MEKLSGPVQLKNNNNNNKVYVNIGPKRLVSVHPSICFIKKTINSEI